MVAPLRLYRATDDDSEEAAPLPAVRVRLGDLLPLVAFAQKMNFMWLKDFLDDEDPPIRRFRVLWRRGDSI